VFFDTAGQADTRSGLLDRFPRARGVHAVRRQCPFDLAYLVHHLEFVLTAQHSDFIFGRSFVYFYFLLLHSGDPAPFHGSVFVDQTLDNTPLFTILLGENLKRIIKTKLR
jgi:hypothetical protein